MVGRARQGQWVRPGPQAESTFQGWAPAAGTCVARALGEEITGEPATLARGCDEDMEVMPGEEEENRVRGRKQGQRKSLGSSLRRKYSHKN